MVLGEDGDCKTLPDEDDGRRPAMLSAGES